MSTAAAPLRWGFIGAGKMATALIRGMIRAGVTPPEQITASDTLAAAREALEAEAGITASRSNLDVAARSDVVVLAVKPQGMPGVLAELQPAITADHLVISIAAGVPLATLAAGLGPDRRLVRVMPNTPALLGEGAAGYCLGGGVTETDETTVRAMLEAVGRSYRVPESLIDAVTGLSGSGPAFVYVMIEALSDGGVRVGLPRDVATALAAQTVAGAARMVLETGLHPGVLKDQVTSPGGTTIAGLHALERGGLRAALIDAVEAATRRSAELAAEAQKTTWDETPMKLGLISDIHGDPLSLELAWAHLTVLGAERIVCAGDVVGYGPYPDAVVKFLHERNIGVARRNHDRWAIERGPAGIDEFGGGRPSAVTLEYLRSLPGDLLIEAGDRVGVVAHGTPRSDMEYLTRRSFPPAVLRGLLDDLRADFLVVGHTHAPMWFRCDHGLVINPGSVVSMPVVRSSRTFALLDLDARDVSFHDVESGRAVVVEPWPDED